MIKRGIGIAHYNRLDKLGEIVEAVKRTAPGGTKIVIADDGSDTLDGLSVSQIAKEHDVILVQGPNKGVSANKNRVLWALQDCHLLLILEDDLKPIERGFFEAYEAAAVLSGIHHFCRVQDKEEEETIPAFSAYMAEGGLTPIYGPSPRGDLTFLTSQVIQTVGGFNPLFRGAGYAHGEWSHRVARAGLINHPQRWVDIKEARDKFVQIGDTEGGRWTTDVSDQLRRNAQVLKQLQRKEYTYADLILE
ncbi:MAG: glycosyltransferase [Methanomassiliicoccales archaeon]|nr:glycosyltransferase [Methanomassiliicoccales archaeon]